jgi:hypothetical protein
VYLQNNQRIPDAYRNMITVDGLDAPMHNLTMLASSVGVDDRWTVDPDKRATCVQFDVLGQPRSRRRCASPLADQGPHGCVALEYIGCTLNESAHADNHVVDARM